MFRQTFIHIFCFSFNSFQENAERFNKSLKTLGNNRMNLTRSFVRTAKRKEQQQQNLVFCVVSFLVANILLLNTMQTWDYRVLKTTLNFLLKCISTFFSSPHLRVYCSIYKYFVFIFYGWEEKAQCSLLFHFFSYYYQWTRLTNCICSCRWDNFIFIIGIFLCFTIRYIEL